MDKAAEAELVEGLASIRHDAFTLSLAEHGSFMPGGVAWIAPAASPHLASLRQATGVAVTRAGLKTDPEWTPHVTLARHAGSFSFPQHSEPVLWHVDRFVLVWSTEGRYVELRDWRLQDPADDTGAAVTPGRPSS